VIPTLRIGGEFELATGKIVEFDVSSSWGLIAPDDGGSMVYVHAEELRGCDVVLGAEVRFSSIQSVYGPKAYNVSLLSLSEYLDTACELVTAESFEYAHEIADILMSVLPEITGADVLKIRTGLVRCAYDRGWLSVA
jgi:cold shock protein